MTGSRQSKDRWEQWVETALRGRHLHEPSASALRRALALSGQLRESHAQRHWLVELLFDSAAEPLPAGVRGTATGPRRLLFQARTEAGDPETCQLDLSLRHEPKGTLELTGQLLPPWSEARVEARTGRTRRTQDLGASGEFLLRNLPGRAESLSLTVRGADGKSIVIAEIPLRPSEKDRS